MVSGGHPVAPHIQRVTPSCLWHICWDWIVDQFPVAEYSVCQSSGRCVDPHPPGVQWYQFDEGWQCHPRWQTDHH